MYIILKVANLRYLVLRNSKQTKVENGKMKKNAGLKPNNYFSSFYIYFQKFSGSKEEYNKSIISAKRH